MTKYLLFCLFFGGRGGAVKSLLVAGAAAKSPTGLVSTDQIIWHRIHVIVRKLSQDNLQMFLLQPTPFHV